MDHCSERPASYTQKNNNALPEKPKNSALPDIFSCKFGFLKTARVQRPMQNRLYGRNFKGLLLVSRKNQGKKTNNIKKNTHFLRRAGVNSACATDLSRKPKGAERNRYRGKTICSF
jgi:hypothetical protein